MVEQESKRIGNHRGEAFELLYNIQEQQRDLKEQLKIFKEEDQRLQRAIEQHQGKIEQLKDSTEEQQRELEKQRRRIDESEVLLLVAHANEMEWIAEHGDPETRKEGNEIFLAANVKLATKAIEFLQERGDFDRAQNASTGFKTIYGCDIDQLEPMLATAPEEIVGILNMRGTLEKRDMWKRNFPKARHKRIRGCDRIISAWLGTGGSSVPDGAKEKCMELSRWMTDRMNDIKKRAEKEIRRQANC